MLNTNRAIKKAIVIGSNCFTGSHIVDALLEDASCEVAGISRSPERKAMFLPYKRRKNARFTFHQMNLVTEMDRLLRFIEQFRPQMVINVAALSEVEPSNVHPLGYFETNTIGVVKLCNQLRTFNFLSRYVHISTAEVYGSCSEPLRENAPLNPSSPYAVSKAGADMYLMTLFKNYGFPAILIRSTNVYGMYQQLYKIIPRAIIYLKMGKPIELHGGGRPVKSWVHICDVADGVMLAARIGKPGVYHFSDANPFSVAEVVRWICDFMGKDFESSTVSIPDRLGQDAQYLLNYSKAKQELGWSPKVSFEEGVKETLSWLEEYWSDVANEPLVNVLST